jgi:N6-L-threonylcarbamoyladenine synthase
MLVLGIETSCDETAVAVVEVETRRILAQQIHSQIAENAPYGGVVPELAARAHLERLPQLTQACLHEAFPDCPLHPSPCTLVDAVAATVAPGLTTALLVGSTFAKTLALTLGKPFLAAHHLEGHALSPMLADPALNPPYLLLLVSGGHTQLLMVHAVGHYEQLGTTLDDAAGECFDKVGKLLGLPHPAGPQIEQLAALSPAPCSLSPALPFPKNDGTLDFSFSGLKTAVRDLLASTNPPPAAAIAAAFQTRVAEILAKKTGLALKRTDAKILVAAGGVAANQTIRQALAHTAQTHGTRFTAPPPNLCTDNAAMIAFAAGLRHQAGLPGGDLTTRPIPRHPLTAAWPPAP